MSDPDTEARDLLRFATASLRPGEGFGWLDADGAVASDEGVHTWITCRMTHVFALATLRGDRSAAAMAEHGVTALTSGPLRDREHDGWFGSVHARGPADTMKAAYPHAFVVLAASTATTAGVPGAHALLTAALDTFDRRFLDDDGRVVEAYDRTFTECEDYRGANSSMHTVEALLAAHAATGEDRWRSVAAGIAEHLVDQVARGHRFRLPEHFTADWEPVPDYNRERPADQFRPYGVTVGHLLEWSRLLLHLESVTPRAADWMPEAAVALFDLGVTIGWEVDGTPGFVYTTDWADRPVVRERMHWVVAEAIAAAATLHARTGLETYARWQRTWWEYVERYVRDTDRGSWHHELDPRNHPAATVWSGKPDVYHAYQATVLPGTPLGPSVAAQVRAAL